MGCMTGLDIVENKNLFLWLGIEPPFLSHHRGHCADCYFSCLCRDIILSDSCCYSLSMYFCNIKRSRPLVSSEQYVLDVTHACKQKENISNTFKCCSFCSLFYDRLIASSKANSL